MKSNIVFVGDSLTAANRIWSATDPLLGEGYVHNLQALLSRQNPDISITNLGYDGLTVSALLERLNRGIITVPDCDLLCLQIGINDIGVSMNTGHSLKKQEFSRTYEQVLQHLSLHASQILCLGPAVFSTPPEYQIWIPEITYAEQCILSLKERYTFAYVSIQTFFSRQEFLYPDVSLSTDGVHPSALGHKLLAENIIHYFQQEIY